MRMPIAVTLIVFGIILVLFGLISSESVGQHVPAILTRHPGFVPVWLLGLGIIVIAAGAATLRTRGSR